MSCARKDTPSVSEISDHGEPQPPAQRNSAPLGSASGLPQTLEDLTAGLQSLVTLGAQYTEQNPREAKSGVWWWGMPSGKVHQQVPAGVRSRDASVLALFWPGAEGPEVLLTERSPELAKHPGQISFPGGGSEEFDVGPAATALREAQEETGLDPARLRVLGSLPPAPIPVSGFHVTPVVAVAEDPGVLVPQSGEVSRVLKVRVADLVEAEHRYTAVVVHRGPRLPSPAFYFGSESEAAAFVWGFTGTLLDKMLLRLGWGGEWDRSREIDPRQFRRRSLN